MDNDNIGDYSKDTNYRNTINADRNNKTMSMFNIIITMIISIFIIIVNIIQITP